jgi:hypothetical protein
MRDHHDRRNSLFFAQTSEKPAQLLAGPGIKTRN